MAESHSLEVQGLSKHFGPFVALDSASFRFEGARTIGYLGPNGAGKTTTLKFLAHLLRPSDGHALIDGIDVRSDPKRALRPVGALIESPEPYAQLRVREALEMVGEFRGLRGADLRQRIQTLHEEFELPPMERRMGVLSKGQRQRVVLAGTVITDPGILLLDEPTSGLDPAERVKVRNFILRLKKDHLILMSSHLLGEVTDTCDDVIFLNQGRIVLRDTVQGIASAIHVNRVEVEFAIPVAIYSMSGLGSLVSHLEPIAPNRYRLSFDGADATRAQILKACLEVAPVLSYAPVGSALEDMYMQVMDQSAGALPPYPPPPPPP